jgi:tetratricopeptide (TPR) repeat protein
LKTIKSLLLLWITLTAVGCSTKVNKFPNRAFHNTTTRFNVLFNGNQSFLEGTEKLESAYVIDYDSLVPLYIFPKDTTDAKTVVELMDRCIEKGEKSITRHSMYIKKEERNKHIDDAYMLIGKANLYKLNFPKANEMFEYVSKAYKKQPEGKIAKLWLSKSNIVEGKKSEAYENIKELQEDAEFPKAHQSELQKTAAYYHITENDYPRAITALEKALESTKKKKEKIKLNFIIGQLYDITNNHSSASIYYQKVLDLKPNYDLMLNTKLKMASHASSGNENEAELLKLLRKCPSGNEKSKVYLALADLELKKDKKTKAENYMQLAAKEAIAPKIKRKAYYKLAEYHYKEKSYLIAKNYYDSTLQTLENTDPLFIKVEDIRNNLGRLVKNLNTIQLQDSLIRLANLSESDRIAAIKSQIKYNKKLLNDKLELKKIEELNQANTPVTASLNTSLNNTTSWYFQNPTTMQFGREEFVKIWGKIPLEDHWRRKDKSNFSFDNIERAKEIDQDNIDNIDVYLQNIPLTPEKMSKSVRLLIDAYYDLGIVYNEKLSESLKAAKDGFDPIVSKHDTSSYAPAAAYFCYNIYSKIPDITTANQYKNTILTKYPNTEYANILRNPNYYADKKAESQAIFPAYENAYTAFKNKDFSGALSQIETAELNYPKNSIESKFLLLKALVQKELSNNDEFRTNLKKILDNYPASEEFELAKQIYEKSNALNPVIIPNTPIKVEEDTLFISNDSSALKFVLVIPLDGVNKVEEIKNKVSDFNSSKFRIEGLNISDMLLNENTFLVVVQSFETDKIKAKKYYDAFLKDKNLLKDVNNKNFTSFLISENNLGKLYKNKRITQYNVFFKSEFLK